MFSQACQCRQVEKQRDNNEAIILGMSSSFVDTESALEWEDLGEFQGPADETLAVPNDLLPRLSFIVPEWRETFLPSTHIIPML